MTHIVPQNAPVIIRSMRADETAFVATAWLKSMKPEEQALLYYDSYRPLIDTLIRTQQVDVLVPDSDDGQLCGFICHSEHARIRFVHYVYVKGPFRGMGLGRMLLRTIAMPAIATNAGLRVGTGIVACAPMAAIALAYDDKEHPVFDACHRLLQGPSPRTQDPC